jgi:hypothetical protein
MDKMHLGHVGALEEMASGDKREFPAIQCMVVDQVEYRKPGLQDEEGNFIIQAAYFWDDTSESCFFSVI